MEGGGRKTYFSTVQMTTTILRAILIDLEPGEVLVDPEPSM